MFQVQLTKKILMGKHTYRVVAGCPCGICDNYLKYIALLCQYVVCT